MWPLQKRPLQKNETSRDPNSHLCTHAHKCACVQTHSHAHILIHITHTRQPLYSVRSLSLPVQILGVTGRFSTSNHCPQEPNVLSKYLSLKMVGTLVGRIANVLWFLNHPKIHQENVGAILCKEFVFDRHKKIPLGLDCLKARNYHQGTILEVDHNEQIVIEVIFFNATITTLNHKLYCSHYP